MPVPKHEKDQRLKGPLSGVRVLELGQLLAGPFTTTRLADFGAEVIKVETPGKGDPMREWGHHRYKGKGLWWPILARNKKSVTANLRVQEGQDLVRRLIKKSDVLVENFKPGTIEKWGMSPDELHKLNPGLIIARVSGFGQTGPYADRPGFASVGEAMGGLRYINGFPDQPPPRSGISLGDTLTGIFAAQGILMALYWRDALGGGKGQVIDASIMESCFTLMESSLPEYDKLGIIREPSGTGLANVAPSNIYPTKEGKYIVIAANVDPMFRRLCDAMGQPELATDIRFVDHKSRGNHAEALDQLIAEWTSKLTNDEISTQLGKFGVVTGPIYTIEDIAKDPQFAARNMIRYMEDPDLGKIAVPGIAPSLTHTAGDIAWLGPQEVGSHNKEIYGQLLEIGEDQLRELSNNGII
ncbi:MAG: CoA transferase [Pseudomonadota bacterium]|nr:CoA transferase [Pseudomonadota bacterium]